MRSENQYKPDGVNRVPKAQADNRYCLVHDGQVVFRGTHNQCFVALVQMQGQSTTYALQEGGWAWLHERDAPHGGKDVGRAART